jgi:tetratricopeptide (TPR) repeat protein
VVDAARVTNWLGGALEAQGEGGRAIGRLREALASLEETTAPPTVLAQLQITLAGTLHFAGGQLAEAAELLENGLTLAQHHELAEQLASGLNSKALLLQTAGRAVEARALYEASISVARCNGIARLEAAPENNLADLCMTNDLPGGEEHARVALALARRSGLRWQEALAAGNLMYILTMAGRLEEVGRLGAEVLKAGGNERPRGDEINFRLAHVELLRGNADAAREHLSVCRAWAESDDVQYRAMLAAAEAAALLAEGRSRQALEPARRAIDEALDGGVGVASEPVRLGFPIAFEAAIDVGDLVEADRLVDMLAARPRGEVPPFLQAQVTRARALVARARGEDECVEENLVAAEASFRELGYPYWTARAQLDRAEWLARQERLDESATLASEAAANFDTIGVVPMGVRARALLERKVIRSASGVDSRAGS